MKTLFKNSGTMKNNHQPIFYFSAYPLKALNLPEDEKKTYLHIYKRENNTGRKQVGLKVLPMTFADHERAVNESKNVKTIQPDNIEDRESDWFASYE